MVLDGTPRDGLASLDVDAPGRDVRAFLDRTADQGLLSRENLAVVLGE